MWNLLSIRWVRFNGVGGIGVAALMLVVVAPAAQLAASDDHALAIADGPKPITVAAWDKYVASIDARYNDPERRFSHSTSKA